MCVCIHICMNVHRRKLRSQTSDLWTDAATVVRTVKEQRGRRNKIKVREKIEKSRNDVFFQCFVAPESQKVAVAKTMAAAGRLKRICKDDSKTHFVAGAVQETFSSEMIEMLAQDADFLRGGCILEHQTFRFAKMILRDMPSISYYMIWRHFLGAVL